MFYQLLFLVYAVLFCTADQFEDECGLEAVASTPLVREGLGVKENQFPWHVAIFHREQDNQFELACGGSLVRSNLVISAAHCFSNRAHSHQVHVADYRIVGGVLSKSWNSTEVGRQQSEVREVRLGEEYGASIRNYEDDISIIYLTTRFTFSDTVRAVCLDLTDMDLYNNQTSPGTMGKVAGWGLTKSGAPSDSLNFLGVPVVAREQCLDKLPYYFKTFFTSDKICAGFTNGTAVCAGDSGGGLVFPLQNSSAGPQRFFLRGILSNAPSSSNSNNPCLANVFALYTNIYKHRMWLSIQMDDNLPRECGLEAVASTPLVRWRPRGVNANQFPWHVAIFHREENNQFKRVCGGSLVRSNLVISVAHCFSDRAHSHQVHVADYRVVAGVRSFSWNSIEIGRQQSEVLEVRLGEKYGGGFLSEDDISIIYLTTSFTFSDTVRPVCLDLTDMDLYTNQTSPGTVGKVAGWGLTESGVPSDSLNFPGVSMVAREECIDKLPTGFKKNFTSDKLCAGFTKGVAVCQGDSGGGLVFPLQNTKAGSQRWFLRGVLKNAPPPSRNASDTCPANVYALYINIFSHRMWLTTQIDESLP